MKLKNLIATTLFSLLAAAAAAHAGEADVIRLSEPTEATDTHELFGAPLPDSGEYVGIGDLVADSETYQGREVLVETRIAKVCQKKGCFFVAQHEADTVRVTFKDYAFFIPTDSGGKTVRLAGTFSREPLSREEAEHHAEDLGEEAPDQVPEFQYAIVASGIWVPKT